MSRRPNKTDKLLGGSHSRVTSGTIPYSTRYSQWGTPEEWEVGFNRFWSGELNPDMKDVRRISPNNPKNFDLTGGIKNKGGRPKKKEVDLDEDLLIVD